MSDLRIIVEAAEAIQQSKHWFFELQVLWGGLLALTAAGITAYQLYKATKLERTKIYEAQSDKIMAIAAALQSECQLNHEEFESFLIDPHVLDGRIDESDVAPQRKDFYDHTFFDLHKAEIGNLGGEVCREIIKSYRDAQTLTNWHIKYRKKWNEAVRTSALVEGRLIEPDKENDLRTLREASIQSMQPVSLQFHRTAKMLDKIYCGHEQLRYQKTSMLTLK